MEGQNKHFSHIHNLTIHQIPEGNEITCSGCNFSGTSTVYACWQCNFFLHEQCFRATRFFRHPSHPSHPLTLLPFPTYPTNSFYCNSCNQVGTGLTYCCSDCEFDLHVHCAYSTSTPSLLAPDTNIFPHLNPPPPDQAPNFYGQQVYMPQESVTHEAIIPNDAPIHSPHVSNFNSQTTYMPQYASIPHEAPTNQPILSSPFPNYPPIIAPQDSDQHPQPIPNNQFQNYSPVNESLPSPNVPQNSHTPHVASHKPINPNVPIPTSPPRASSFPCLNPTNGVSNKESPSKTDKVKTHGIIHFSHPHALQLVSPEAEDDSTQCSACEQVISGSRFSCPKSTCDFHLDKSCFMLVGKIQHKSHPEHPLTLVSSPYDNCSGQFTCSACQNDGAGFTYHCATCQYVLHIQCASLLESVKREDHDHTVKLFYSSPNKELGYSCDACHGTIQEDSWAYYCEECDNSYHVDCVNCEESPEEEPESSTGNPILDAQLRLQKLQLQLQTSQLQLQMSRQNAQFVISCGQSMLNLV